MEKNINSFFLKENQGLSDEEIRMMNPVSLAFLGDGVYELFVRGMIIDGDSSPGKLHKKSAKMVKAKSQAKAISLIFNDLTKEEQSVFRRGRNAHSHTMAKNASVGEYRMATGLEALFGYLFLKGEMERLEELFHLIKERSRC
ncbi:MAG: ribonuclease III domain-containing protein [Tissierellia bacterium]|nr:ribonuclease III domain-containing protein [Tissierellia bacterium]